MVLEIITVFGKLTKIIDVHDFIFIEKLVSRNIPLLNVYFGSFLMLRWVVNRVYMLQRPTLYMFNNF